ncbi:exosortase, cyanobacterial variant [Pleurocapsa sp. PCC 7327]|uniref:cyanoexosortase A n=1 Tax=Pleurocapsa sp. PCC 7327 TaxID=118163 RepID=UPI00029FD21A|nr:cyanoexosortase A [Pleurocapsa sp. PCC 7327]AFY79396.1 exosortase, cyanobacterial variant [Pleurocapsa sp. PCC 7327]
MNWLKTILQPNYWLLSLAAALVALHLTYLSKADEPNLMSLSLLFWLGIASSIWDRRDKLNLESGIFSTFLGISLIALILLRSLAPAGYHIRISPFVSGLGLCLIASGIKRLHHYWKELLILGLLVLYPVFSGLLKAIDLSTLTAKFSTFMLWAAGFNAYREGTQILMPTGRVEVYGACSGIDSIILMLCISVLFLLIVPLSRVQQTICMLVAIVLGFFINSLRVSILAILVAYSQQNAFDYWHGGDGSFIFSMISVFLFGTFCWWAYVRHLTVTPNSGEPR